MQEILNWLMCQSHSEFAIEAQLYGAVRKKKRWSVVCRLTLSVHWLRFITSGASYILRWPSVEHDAWTTQAHISGRVIYMYMYFLTSCRPKCLGANLTSLTAVLLSTRLVLFTWGISQHTQLKYVPQYMTCNTTPSGFLLLFDLQLQNVSDTSTEWYMWVI